MFSAVSAVFTTKPCVTQSTAFSPCGQRHATGCWREMFLSDLEPFFSARVLCYWRRSSQSGGPKDNNRVHISIVQSVWIFELCISCQRSEAIRLFCAALPCGILWTVGTISAFYVVLIAELMAGYYLGLKLILDCLPWWSWRRSFGPQLTTD